MNNTNQIDSSAQIHENVILGSHNRIGKNVIIDILGNNPNVKAVIGDNNIINDNTKILVYGTFTIGDWNVFHNDMLIMAEDHLTVGHNGWFGQNTILDGAGGLEIGNGVRVGMYSQIWTHVASGEQIEGCTLYSKRKTVIEDDVWLVGSCIVSSGITLGKRSTALINSVLTKDTLANRAYAGSPAKLMENVTFYIEKTLDEKFEMLHNWLTEFVAVNNNHELIFSVNDLVLKNVKTEERVRFSKSLNEEDDQILSVFYLFNKTFRKTNSELERKVYKFLYGNKARFIPIEQY